MASIEDVAFRNVDTISTDSDTNVDVVVTLPAPGSGFRWVVTAITISANDAPGAAVRFTCTENGAEKFGVYIPGGSKFAPIHMNHVARLAFADNAAVVFTLPALGAGVTGELAIFAYKRSS